MIAHLGDLSETLHDIEVAERGHRHEKCRIAIKDSNGDEHLLTVMAERSTDGRWHIENARWCLTDLVQSDTSRNSVTRKQRQLRTPADLSDCSLIHQSHCKAPELPQGGYPTPGAVFKEILGPLPNAGYTITVKEPTAHQVPWKIRKMGGPWGLIFATSSAVQDNGWRLQTNKRCHI